MVDFDKLVEGKDYYMNQSGEPVFYSSEHKKAMKGAHEDWHMTLNNYTEEDCRMFESWADEVKMICISKEVGACGTAHLQGRIKFRRTYRLSGLKKLHSGVHWEPTKCRQDSLYCLKEGSDILIKVDNRKQGKRTDLDDIVEAVKAGKTEKQLWLEHPKTMIRYSKGILELKKFVNPRCERSKFTFDDFPGWDKITDFTKSQIVIGESGIGKTQWALCHFENPLFVRHIDDLKELSEDHDGIVFDDMDFKHWARNPQIFLLDNDQGSSINCRYYNGYIPAGTRKIFTCNELPFDFADKAISRRAVIHKLELETCERERSGRKVILNSTTLLTQKERSVSSDTLEW